MERVRDTAGSTVLPWFGLAYAVFILNDVLFIRTTDWPTYLAIDYGSRFLALAFLLLPRAPRRVALQRESLHVGHGCAFILVVGVVLWDRLLGAGFLQLLANTLGNSRLTHFPALPFGIRQFDAVVGVLLVAISEEVLCRRVAKVVLRAYLANDTQVILVSALLFAAMHWSQG